MKTNRWKKRMAILLILLAGGHYTARPGVIITGLLDGTLDGGCPKVIEVFVTGTENLNYYEIWRSLNGAPFGSGSGAIASMSGTFTNTFVYLVKTDHVDAFHDVFGNEGFFANVVPMGIINGNGNDGFQVRLKVGSVVIDQVWYENTSNSYEDSYWYRKHGTGPDGGWLSSNWETPGNNALDGLDQDGLQAAVPFGTYAMAWQGISDDWNNTLNWSLGIVPSFQTNVLVRDTAAFFPVITNFPSEPAVCMNLTIADSASLTVQAGKALTVYGDLRLDTLASGEFNDGLVLGSDQDQVQSGSLILMGSVTGKVRAHRYIGKDNGWHFIASTADSQLFQPEFVPDPVDNTYDFYYWEETGDLSSGWVNSRDEAGQWNPLFGDAFIPAKGYLVAYSPLNDGQETRTFSGAPFTGSLDIPLSHSGNYWNLLGNPYTCALDWSSAGINKEAVAGSSMYIWDPSWNEGLGGYRIHNGETGVPAGSSPFIPALQGFFVQSLIPGELSIDVTSDDPLVHGDQEFYKQGNELAGDRIRMRISNGLFSDEILVCFVDRATNGFDPEYDAVKLFNGHEGCPEIYSLSAEEHKLVINMLDETPAAVNLGLSYSSNEDLVLEAFDFEGLYPATGIFLEDRLPGSWTDLREQQAYSFTHDPLHTEDRFILHFMNTTGKENPNADKPGVWCYGNQVYIDNPGNRPASISIFTLEGKCIQHSELREGRSMITVSASPGLYILNLSVPSGILYQKIFINK